MKSETQIDEAAEQVSSRFQVRRVAQSVLRRALFLGAIDLVLGFACYVAAWMIRGYLPLPYTQSLLPHERWGAVSHPWLALIFTQVFFPYVLGLFDDLRRTRYREIMVTAFIACLLQMLTVTSIFFLTNQVFPRSVILVFDALNLLALTLWRVYLKGEAGKLITRVLIVGETPLSVREIAQEIETSPWMGMRIVGVVLHKNGDRAELGYPVLGELHDVQEVIAQHQIDEIVFASQLSWKDHFLNAISQLQESTAVRVVIIPSPFEMVISRLRHINIHDTPLIELSRNPNEPLERFLKRAFDLTFSALGLLLSLPLAIPVALAIKLNSPGPVFYIQERVGFAGRIFKVIKFRTMVDGAENQSGAVLASENDPRVTYVGRLLRRFRIDEIPQLLNVFRGTMSFVGPRPERPNFVETFLEQVPGYNERHKVKPGVTGLAQVRSYYDTTPEKKLKYDLAYIYNYSFSLDLLILLQTIKTVLLRKGS
jgi:exopolysaccharide biosynthesis polyprenyl glycosylphosphotransferase